MKKIVTLLLIGFFCLNAIEVNAKNDSSYILLDCDSNRILYENNKDQRLLTASICKVLTSMVAIENGELFTFYEVKEEDLKTNGSAVYLQVGDKIALIDLIYALLLRSGNDAALMISRVVFGDYDRFILEMNRLAHKIGMFNSTFENPSGLDDESYNYSTAYDMALLMSYAVENETFLEICGARSYRADTVNNTYYWIHKHKLLRNNDFIKAAKTGFTTKAKRTLITYAEVDDKRLVAVSFNQSDDYNLHLSLFKKAAQEFSLVRIFRSQVFPQELDLYYYPELKEDVSILIKEGSKLTYKLKLLKECKDICGYLFIYEDNILIYQANLYPYWVRK